MMKLTTALLCGLCTFSSLLFAKQETNANDILDKVRKNLTSLSGNFQQYEVDVNNRTSDVSTGQVWLRAPDQFKWQYQTPVPQLIVANGKKVWVYDEDLEQVTVKQQRSQQNPIYVLLNKELSEKNYLISVDQQTNKSHEIDDNNTKLQWIKMQPVETSDEVKVVWLGIDDDRLVVLKLQNQLDNLVVFEFADIKKNPSLSDDFFTFSAPEGTDVISESANIGEF